MGSSMGTHCSGRSRAARVGRLLVAGVLLAGVVACGTQFVYNRLDWLTHYYLSSQVSLDGGQSRELRRGLESFFAWHRRNELPRYAAFLDRMANDTARPVSFAQLEAGRREIEKFMRDAVGHGAPEAARWFNGLRPEQVDELFASLADGERKARKENCEADPAERREKSVERFTDNVEDWTGRLSRAQRELIANGLATFESDACTEVSTRERSRVEFRSLVDQYRQRPEFAERIAVFLTHPEERWDGAYRRNVEADRARFMRLLADINQSLTPAQRKHTVERLRGYARELRQLAAEPAA
jgi:hypothetical protein